MYTSMIGLAVSAMLSSNAPQWQIDYRDAKALAAREHKPLVVVLCGGTGVAAWNGIATEGSLGAESLKILKDSYVCLYVDPESDKGRRLAADFELRSGPALIISDKSGDLQAYHHDGALPSAQLTTVFRQYATQDRAVTRTESNHERPNTAPSYFTPPALQQQCLT